MSLSYTSAMKELLDTGDYSTVASLWELCGSFSGAVRSAQFDDTYLLFSGKLQNGTAAVDVVYPFSPPVTIKRIHTFTLCLDSANMASSR